MHKYQKYKVEARGLMVLAVPVIITQVAQTAMGVVDTIMAGSFSATDLAAVAIGTSIWQPVIFFGNGLLLALTPTIAQLNGSGRRNQIAYQVRQGFWLACFIAILMMLVLYNSHHIIYMMHNIDPILAEKAVGFIRAIMWGVPGCLFFQIFRNQCEGLSKTKPGMVIGFMGLLINIPINYIFIYGKLGAPALGGVGCGVATASVYWVMFLMMYWYVSQAGSQQDLKLNKGLSSPDWKVIKTLTFLGLPIALALFFETTLFAVVALLISPLGVVAVAGHQIAHSFSSLVFMLPMSLGIAATIRVGHCLGAGEVAQARVSAYTGLIVGLILASLSAILTVFFREPIALLYNDDPAVVIMASHLMIFAAIYQMSDAVQVIGSGVLRGYKDTRSIFFITFIAYWLLGLSSGYLLGLTDHVVSAMGPTGFWIGFVIGLTFAAVMIFLRIRWLQRQSPEVTLQRAAHH